MGITWVLCKREFKGYFVTPIASVFLVVFWLLSGAMTFYLGDFFARGQADLIPFFNFHPWLYMVFMPAISMRLWAEERKNGTIELLLTLPVTIQQAVNAKFIAAWLFAGIALLGTLPMWGLVNFLGNPDNGVILVSYLGSFFMAGGFLAVGSMISASTKNQVVAFVISSMTCLLLNLAGSAMVMEPLKEWLPDIILETIANFSFMMHFEIISKGILESRSLVFFVSLMICCLFTNSYIIYRKKAE